MIADMNLSFGFWDLLLLLVVSTHATLLAYVRRARLKALLLLLPTTFTLAVLAVGRPIDASNMIGLLDLFVFAHGVRLLHQRWGVPILLSIIVAALLYCLLGGCLARVIPPGDAMFWISSAIVLPLGVLLHFVFPPRAEPDHRTALHGWVKIPAIVLVVFTLIVAKTALGGFFTTFPMVGVLAFYEGRHALWTMARGACDFAISGGLMMIFCRLTQDRIGLGWALVVCWIGILIILGPAFRRLFRHRPKAISIGAPCQ